MKRTNNSGLSSLFAEEEIAPDTDQTVDLPGNDLALWGGNDGEAVINQIGDDIEVSFGDEEDDLPYDSPDASDHEANLAEFMEENELNRIALDIIDEVDVDKESRKPWDEVYRTGIEALGVVEEKGRRVPFNGASSVTYPMLSTAIIQFQARAINEIFPSSGPVKTRVIGKDNEEKREQAKRVTDHMNYQITEEDEGYFDELDQMLFFLPIGGSAFKKVYWDTREDTAVSKFVRPDELIVPYAATSLATAPRYTHQLLISSNDMKCLMSDGVYRDVELAKPQQEKGGNYSAIDSTNDKVDNRTATYEDNDYRHTIYETHKYLDLKKFPHKKDGKTTGIALPYIVTIDLESRKVLAIRRNWKENDAKYKKRIWFVHYKYLPGVGFYGFGLLHIIGGLQRASNGVMRILLDSGAFASLQGGFRSKDGRAKAGELKLTPGEWKDINLTAEELSKAFYTPPFKEPSPALFQLLELIVEASQRVTSTTEAMVGDASNNGPVGTTLALIEQGSKVYSGIHKRLHHAAKYEFRLRASLNFQYLEHDEEYPYDVEGDSRFIKGSDYDDNVDVMPFSDPNVFSSTQRIAKAQSVMQLSETAPPGMYNMYKTHKRMLEAMEVSDIDEILPDPTNIERLDPVTENQMLMMNKSIKAQPDQNHTAHIQVHMAFFEHPSFGGDPNIRQMIAPQMIAHLAEHKAYEYRDMMTQSGALTMTIDVAAKVPGESMTEELPAEDEFMMSQAQAQVLQQFMQMHGVPVSPPGGQPQDPAQMQAEAEAARAQADMQAKKDNHVADMQMKDESFAKDQDRQDEQLRRDESRKDAQTRANLARDHASTQVKLKQEAALNAAKNKGKTSKSDKS